MMPLNTFILIIILIFIIIYFAFSACFYNQSKFHISIIINGIQVILDVNNPRVNESNN